MTEGYELKTTANKGSGIFSTIVHAAGEIVMAGLIKSRLYANSSHASQIGMREFAFHSGLIPKVNHSCDPNCGIKPNFTGAHDFIARRRIEIGEEITFDYAMSNYLIEHFPDKCECRSELCRTHITGWKDLPVDRKRAYAGFVAPYLMRFDSQATGLALLS